MPEPGNNSAGWLRRLRITSGAVALTVGTITILTGICAAGVVAGIDSLVGRTGVVSQDMGSVVGGPADVAIVVDGVQADINPGRLPSAVTDGMALLGISAQEELRARGSFVLLATPPGEGEAFLALGSPAAVDDYLFGYPYAVAELAGDRSWREISVPGEGRPKQPAEVGWVTSAQGRPAELPAAQLSGQTLVIMRPDASPPAGSVIRLEYRVPEAPVALRSAAIVAASSTVGGLLLVLLGAWLVVGRKPKGRHA